MGRPYGNMNYGDVSGVSSPNEDLQTQVNLIASTAATAQSTANSKLGLGELGSGGSGLQVVGTTDVNLSAGSLINSTEIIALNGKNYINNINKVIVTNGQGGLSWVRPGQKVHGSGASIGLPPMNEYQRDNVLHLNGTQNYTNLYHSNATYIQPVRLITDTTGYYDVKYHPETKELVCCIPQSTGGGTTDNEPPTLSLTQGALGGGEISLQVGDTYVEYGARIIDGTGDGLTTDIGPATVSGSVDTSTPGSYTITYTGQDAAGNQASPITRRISVVNPVPSHQYNFTSSSNSYTEHTLTFADGSTAIATGTVTWSSSSGVTTNSGGALQLNSFETGGSCSIEWYGTLDAMGQWHRLWSFYDNTDLNLALYRSLETNQLILQHNNGGHQAITSMSNLLVPGEAPVHVVCTINVSGDKIIYLNGVASSTENNTLTPFTTQTYTNHFIGRDAWGDSGTETTRYFAYYNTELTQSQVTSIYQVRLTTPLYEYNFTSSSNTFSHPTLTFADGSTATATGASGTVTWSSSSGVTTNPSGALRLTSFQIGGAFSIEWYGSLVDAGGQDWQKLWSFYNDQTYNLSLTRNFSENALSFALNGLPSSGGHRAVTPESSLLAAGGQPIHVVCTMSTAGNKVIYLNGVASSTEEGNAVSLSPQTYTYHVIGRDAWGDVGTETTRYFAYYNTELTQSQVTSIYQTRTV